MTGATRALSLVTGASRGIGRSVATRLAAAGHRVVCCGRTSSSSGTSPDDVLRGVVASLPGSGHLHAVLPDLQGLTAEAAAEAVRAVLAEADGGDGADAHVEHVVHAAGVAPSGLLLRSDGRDLAVAHAVNVAAPLLLTRAVLVQGRMLKRGGAVCFLGSVVGRDGNAGQTAYAASKAALVGAAKSLAKEVGSRGVRVNVVAPGFVDTDMTATLSEERRAAVAAAAALGRMGDPDDVAHAVQFALTNRYFTGQVLCVDGGLTL